jgi:hypothetical protein
MGVGVGLFTMVSVDLLYRLTKDTDQQKMTRDTPSREMRSSLVDDGSTLFQSLV